MEKKMRILNLTKDEQDKVLASLIKRSPANYTEQEGTVREIIDNVRRDGDAAIFAYEEKFDHCRLTAENIRVTKEEIEAAYQELDPSFVEAIPLLR